MIAESYSDVSTHSRPKAAGWPSGLRTGTTKPFQLTAARRRLGRPNGWLFEQCRFNSQPPEGGWVRTTINFSLKNVSTHSRPKAAGPSEVIWGTTKLFQLTAARRRLAGLIIPLYVRLWFQLTAARRRLVPPLKPLTGKACIALFR